MKIYITLAAIAIYTAMLIMGTLEFAAGREAKKTNKIIENKIENHNEDKKTISKSQKRIDATRIIYRDRIIKIPDIRPSNAAIPNPDCLRDISFELRNEVYRSFPVYPAGSDTLHDANP